MKVRVRYLMSFLFVFFGLLLGACGNSNDSSSLPQVSEEMKMSDPTEKPAVSPEMKENRQKIDKNGFYTSKEEVALYIHTFGKLPDNYITKKAAQKQGWDSKQGNLTTVAPGKSIGGSHFGNYEGQLPEKEGREWIECDIDYTGGRRNAKRIIYSNDGLIYYTEDHYKSFELLYE